MESQFCINWPHSFKDEFIETFIQSFFNKSITQYMEFLVDLRVPSAIWRRQSRYEFIPLFWGLSPSDEFTFTLHVSFKYGPIYCPFGSSMGRHIYYSYLLVPG